MVKKIKKGVQNPKFLKNDGSVLPELLLDRKGPLHDIYKLMTAYLPFESKFRQNNAGVLRF